MTVVSAARERVSLNNDWRFSRFTSNPDSLSYDVLKSWMLPSANGFLNGKKYDRPPGTAPGSDVKYTQANFDDSLWQALDLPHDWAVAGPFDAPGVPGGLGRLPINGVGWYRNNLTIDAATVSSGKSVYLDFDGSMSYTAVWLNGNLVGGWPFGYNSFRLDLTPYIKAGANTLAVRVDNALDSSRWYPGAGIYRNLWLVTVDPVHVGQYGTHITTPSVSTQQATVKIVVDVENNSNSSQKVDIATQIFTVDASSGKASGAAVASFSAASVSVPNGSKRSVNATATVSNPKLWGPPPTQQPHLYVAITTLTSNGTTIDTYETIFGIRTIAYSPNQGLLINGEHVRIYGTCNHHDLGSIGTAFNYRAAERQFELLKEMGNNGLRTSHNPPAPEWLELANKFGMIVMDELFDTWTKPKVKNDFSRIFADWHEPDTRNFIRRDRNHPSVISWSIGNELSEQSDASGGSTGRLLQDIVHQEDSTRLVTVGMNNAGPSAPLSSVIDIIGTNYQGEGKGTSFSSSWPNFHSTYPDKMIWSTESSSCVSSRGKYLFPVTPNKTAVVGSGSGGGGDATNRHVSAYELYSPSWASSPDKVFEQHDRFPYVAGEFVWTGFDYIGEPTPYDSSRSSYFGIIDLAGFRKDRFYIYQARWRPDLPMAHLLPHWTWPGREGQTTPVHVFTSGDEAELFVNGKSAGRKKKGRYEYRIRFEDVKYAAGSIRVVTYKNGAQWATAETVTAGSPVALNATADRTKISGDGKDLSFITVKVVDEKGVVVPEASNSITARVVSGSGKIVSTDNGDPTDKTVFSSTTRKAFSGMYLAIVKANRGTTGDIVVELTSNGLSAEKVTITAT
ncbi:glycoside hydrolase family 2 protein [Pyrenochaeta sp. DS3sAY3a]|nr:glycoside hydrolase family 2 protein [Pyrenochaeta sp. DS3sAY3a]